MRTRFGRSAHLLMGCCLFAVSHPAFAQNAPAEGELVEEQAPTEIIVTANKREERLQDVPVAVTVLSGAQLSSQNITSAADLTRSVPSLSGSTSNASAALTIRGIGTAAFSRSAEGSVGLVLDGVALGNTSAAAPQLFDVSRVEVLEGPQGMLFGRNASAGLINVVTNDPSTRGIDAKFHADIGTRNSLILQGVVNLPVGDDAALRISGAYAREPDRQFNVISRDWFRTENAGGRARFKWSSGAFTLNLIGDYNRKSVNGGSSFAVYKSTGPGAGIGAPGSALETSGSLINAQLTGATCGLTIGVSNDRGCTDGSNRERIETWGISNQMDVELGGATVTSITAYRELDSIREQDSDSIPLDVLNTNSATSRLRNFSQEIRLTSPDDGFLTYVAGLYYFNSEQDHSTTQAGKILFGLDSPVVTTPLPPTHPAFILYALYLQTGVPASLAGTPYSTIRLGQANNLDISSESMAAFGQATFNFTDRFRGIAGFRYGSEDVSMRRTSALAPGVSGKFPSASLAPLSANVKDTYFSYRLGAQYDFADSVMGYVTYTRGYKGPSTNDQIGSPVSGGITVPLEVKPEIPHAWEAGIKASLFDRKLALNVSLFHTRTTDFQAQFYDLTRGGFVFSNAPELTSKGFQVQLFGKPTPELTVNAGVILADAKYGPGFKVQCAQLQTAAQGCETDPLNASIKYDDADGNRLPFSPKWKANVGFEYARSLSESLDGFVALDGNYSSRINYSSANDPLASTGPHFLIGGRIGVRSSDQRFGISLWGRNLTDRRVPVFMLPNPIVGFGGRADPQTYIQIFGSESYRTLGLSLDARF